MENNAEFDALAKELITAEIKRLRGYNKCLKLIIEEAYPELHDALQEARERAHIMSILESMKSKFNLTIEMYDKSR